MWDDKTNNGILCDQARYPPSLTWEDPEEDRGPDPFPLKKHKNIGFPCNIDLDPL